MNLDGRIKKLRSQLRLPKPATSPPALILRFVADINRNASDRTQQQGEPSWMVMLPRGYRGPLREGAYTQEEWQANFEKKPHSK